MAKKIDDAPGLFLIGGIIKSQLKAEDRQVVEDHISTLLQVHNLVILIGSGASFHLGSPSTRNLSTKAVEELIIQSGGTVTPHDGLLLIALNPKDSGDLEKLLNGLQLAVALSAQAGDLAITLGSGTDAKEFEVDEVEALRKKIGTALAYACRLPGGSASIDKDYRDDPLLAHRRFISRIVRSRRANLPRPRVFTTNYDLVIERALDTLGYPYIDGFSGTVDRRLNLAFYGLDFHRVETTSQQVLARAESALYLHKIHGSLNWRAVSEQHSTTGVESVEVRQVAEDAASDDERVLIYPTTAKEGDTLAYPYSDLMRLLGDAVQQDDTAIISVGYGFADPHINRILLRSLAMNPALSVLVADPSAVLEQEDLDAASQRDDIIGKSLMEAGLNPKNTAVSALAQGSDSRIAVLTGEKGKFTAFSELMPDPATDSGIASPAAVADLLASLEAVLKQSTKTHPTGEGNRND
ncbi:SIR2-like protein [Leucobacter luti]|uniref:SIR2-like protein n=1 Tax=Leucobacter luti TaxID=340320 RepID=A0A4V3CXC9_9MICO|nr:SIR2 family protein [Leucobacter luti]TDP89778.1 SIR2-like protein [Leucobacter luti]